MKRSKPLVIVLCTVLLVAATILGTVAYLTDTSEVVNTFTMGQVDIRLDEAVVDENGNPVGDKDGDNNQDRTETGNKYHLLPGMTYTKDPTLTVVRGSEESYVRLLVTINCYSELAEIFGDPFLPQYFVEGWDNTVWVDAEEISKDETNNTATYEFRYRETVKPTADADLILDALFDSIIIPDDMTGAELATIANLEIIVEGHAIQAAGFANADEAWAAFKK